MPDFFILFVSISTYLFSILPIRILCHLLTGTYVVGHHARTLVSNLAVSINQVFRCR